MVRSAAHCGLLWLAACAASHESTDVLRDVEDRTGHQLQDELEPDQPASLPEGVRVDDGLTEDEAVAIALWNSPRLRADLTRLESARGDLAGARRPSNPTLRFLFPAGPQQLGLLLTWPLENLAFSRRRISVAQADLDAVARSVVQTAVEVARDARLAHVEWQLAVDRMEVRQTLAERADELAAIVEARGLTGDVPPREGDAARTDALVASDEARRATGDVELAEARLRVQLGWTDATGAPLRPQPEPTSELTTLGPAELEALALESRPDLRASQLSIDAARARLRLARVGALRFAAVGSGSGTSFTGGPQVELPIFDQNQASIARAHAQLEAAQWTDRQLRMQAIADVTQARIQYDRALASLTEYRDAIVGARERDLEIVTRTFEVGEIDYSGVLIASQQLQSARLREVELQAEVRRALAELERALGRRLETVQLEEAAS
ncbi:TolC family protein [Paraliomyxa miuraensis]|uniref:TolC family protein n=1 Tax=Paraliomyxa miuraensis TaxID=376150 RepID=UPI0022522BE9|nr:TolC family protein [Paraliomyxa miuraensis]MCX4248109.1 TolC family protein [Paraliomyxa miuraensis]